MIREDAINISLPTSLEEKADLNFENIKESVKGIYEIFKINFDDNDIYFKAGLDNIIGIYQNFLELMLNDYGARQFMKKLRSAEIEIDIPLDFLLEADNAEEENEEQTRN
ncbi:MAG: hypothetical protein ACFFAS_16795 [Promethearchaeota archaeon]